MNLASSLALLTAALQFLPSEEAPAKRTRRSKVAKSSRGESGVNVHLSPSGNLLVGGHAVFPIEIYGARWDEDFAITKAHGFNTVIEFGENIEDRAERFGMMLIDPNWMGRDNTLEQVAAKADKYRNKRAVIAYNLNDEPDLRPELGVGPADLERIADFFRKKDPRRLLSVTCAGGAGGTRLWPEYASFVDVLRINPYPVIGGVPLSLVTERLKVAHEAVGPGKPVWVILQAWFMGDADSFPTDRQDRCMTYLALAGGANAISHFDFNIEVWSQFPAFWNGLIQNNRELRLLSPALLGGQVVPATSSQESIKVSANIWKNSVIVLMANQSDQELDAQIKIKEKRRPTSSFPIILFKERKAPEELIPILLKSDSDGISFDVLLPGHGVHVLQIPLSIWHRKIDGYPLAEAPISPHPAIRGIERSRGWLRIKNTSDYSQTAILSWKSRTPEIIETDIAFRPMRYVRATHKSNTISFTVRPQTAYEIGRRPGAFDPFDDMKAFKRVGLNLEFTAPDPIDGCGEPLHRYRCFQGAVIPIQIDWTSSKAVHPSDVLVKILEDSWHPKLIQPPHDDEQPGRAGQLRFEITAPTPERPDRDETITLRISRGGHSITRRMRFRYQRPFELDFEWLTGQTGQTDGVGVATLENQFEEYAFKDLRLITVEGPEGWQVQLKKKSEFVHELNVHPQPGTGEGQVHRFRLEASATGIPSMQFDLPGLLVSEGKTHVAQGLPRKVRVPAIPAPSIDGTVNSAEWKQASSLVGFLGLGVAAFSERQPRAWIAHNEKSLFVAAHLPAETVRVRPAEHDKVDWSDDLFELYLDVDSTPTFHCILANANGVVSDFVINPALPREQRLNLQWDSHAVVRTQRDKTGWSLEMHIPLNSLPENPLGANPNWRFNIRTPHGVAPRYAEIFSFSSQWMPVPSEMAYLTFD